MFAGVVEDRALGQGDVRRHPCDGYPVTVTRWSSCYWDSEGKTLLNRGGHERYGTAFSPALKFVLQKVKERFLHHVCHLEMKTSSMRQHTMEVKLGVKQAHAANFSSHLVAFERRPD